MTVGTPFIRRVGTGPAVVCLHSNASTSGQWRSLSERLAARFTVHAIDSLGAGRSPPWPADPRPGLDAELALIGPVLDEAGDAVHLVGHSFGAAVALKAAIERPGRVRSIAVYEPTLFWLLGNERDCDPSVQGIRDAAASAGAAIARGDDVEAARLFIDFWMGAGSWDAMPDQRRPAIAASMRDIDRWAGALWRETAPLAAFAALDMPVLYMVGGRSPSSGRAPADVVVPVLPRAERLDFPELGHMGPVTHPQRVDEAIERFLTRGT